MRSVLLLLAVGWLLSQPVWAARNEGLENEHSLHFGVHLAQQRSQARALGVAKRLVAEGRFAESIPVLVEILQADEDAFLPDQDAGSETQQSLKNAATSLLAALPPAGQQAYLLEVQAESQRAWQQAVNQGEEAIAQVAAKYPFTQAGRAAQWSLARMAMDQGKFYLAQQYSQRLLADPGIPSQAASGLKAQVLLCLLLTDQSQQALAFAKLNPAATAGVNKLLGNKLPAQEDLASWIAQMMEQLAAQHPHGGVGKGAWWLAGGQLTRNPIIALEMPHWWARWTHELPSTSQSLSVEAGHQLSESGLLPSCPLVVRDCVVARSAEHLYGIVRTTGKLAWRATLRVDKPPAGSATLRRRGFALQLEEEQIRSQLLDSVSANLASNGRLVFAVAGSTWPSGSQRAAWRRNWRRASQAEEDGNEIVAIDVAAEGKLVWRTADLQDSRSATYLGCPLPLHGKLYAVLEEEQTLFLEELDQSTGHRNWRQPLVTMEVPVGQLALRRLVGVELAYSQGVLVCSTGLGMVLGISPVDRTLQWVHRFPVQSASADDHGASFAGHRVQELPALNRCGWLRNQLQIYGQTVLATSPETRSLHAIDLATGESQWERRLGPDRLLCAVDASIALVVGKQQIEGWNLANGTRAWRTELPGEALPNSPGALFRRGHLLPLADGTALLIDPATGEIATRYSVAPEGQLGCLAVDGDSVYSQSLTGLARFEIAGAESMRTSQTLAAQTRFVNGDRSAAIAGFSRLHGQQPSSETEYALQTLLQAEPLLSDTASKGGGLRSSVEEAMQNLAAATSEPQLKAAARQILVRQPGNALQLVEPGWAILPEQFAYARLHEKLTPDQLGEWLRQTKSQALGPIQDALQAGLDAPRSQPGEVEEPIGVSGRQWALYQSQQEYVSREPRVRQTARTRPSRELVFDALPLTHSAGEVQEIRATLVSSSDGRMVGLDAFGEQSFSIGLVRSSPDHLRRRVASGDPVAGYAAGRFIADTGEDVIAIEPNALGQPAWSAHDRLLGVRCLGPRIACQQLMMSLRNAAREQLRFVSASPSGVIVAGEGVLACLSPSSGQVLWARLVSESRGAVTADPRYVYSPVGTRQAWKVRVSDGRHADSKLPDGRVIAQAGGRIALRYTDEQETVVKFFDRGQEVFGLSRRYAGEIKWCSSPGLLVVMDQTGRLEVIDLVQSRVVVQSEMPMEQAVESLSCLALGGRLVIAANQAARHVVRSAGVTPVDRHRITSGPVMAFDRTTGQPLWPAPAQVELVGLLTRQPAESPFIAFGARVRSSDSSGRFDSMQLLLLDAATGRTVCRKASLRAQRGSDYQISVQHGTWPQYTIGLDSKKLVLSLTSHPLPPAPPFTAQVEAARPQVSLWEAGSALGRLLERGFSTPGDKTPPAAPEE